MPHERTDPVQTPPPPVGGWEVVHSHKYAAGSSSDMSPVDTGAVYDDDYEYFAGVTSCTSPSPANTAPTVSVEQLFTFGVAAYFSFKPDGVTAIVMSSARSGTMYIPAKQIASVLADTDFGNPSTGTSMTVSFDSTGKFWRQYTQDNTRDRYCFVARRRRYG